MKKLLKLNGNEWNLVTLQGDIKASVPGCVHTDMLANGLIDDPFYRDNESGLMWIGHKDWTYYREFTLDSDFCKSNHVELVCKGLDTLAVIKVNGKHIASTDNMFREYAFKINDAVKVGKNTVEITFPSTFPYAKEKMKERHLAATGIGHHRLAGSNYIRKMQCNYGWDWGPMCVTAGIWRDINIIAYEDTKINCIKVEQDHHDDSVDLHILTQLDGVVPNGYKAIAKVEFEGEILYTESYALDNKKAQHHITIKNPELWWPNNLGKQNLYKVIVEVLDTDSKVVDTMTQSVGLRTLVLDRHDDEWGESFQFVVNGIPFFAKGANWIPKDAFVTRHSVTDYRSLLTSAKQANMNFIRVWGGGVYEDDEFYDLCDELGLCVWQDFMFACSAYPTYDEKFMETVRFEIIDNVKRLRNHPCIALWCGNNEIEHIDNLIDDDIKDGAMTWDEYKYLFDDYIYNLVNEYDGQHSYWSSSPMSSYEDRSNPFDPTRGDAHLWDVWHGRKPFEWYRTCEHRFNSEFGFQSFPQPDVVYGYTLPEDRNITSFVMEKHQRSDIGNDAIMQYMLSWFKLPTSFDMLLWTSQILQSLAIKYAVEHWRRKMPQGMGTLYWQLNDCWPVASWSSIDYFGNWKALNYSAKRFFAPILISGVENKERIALDLYLSNDTLSQVEGKVIWEIVSLDGKKIINNELKASVDANTSTCIQNIDLATEVEQLGGIRNVAIFYKYIVDEEVVSQNTSYFERPKHMVLQRPNYCVNVEVISSQEFKVEISADVPALWVWCQLDGVESSYSNNFFDLNGNESQTIIITTKLPIPLDEFSQRLNINSIVDTFY